MGKKEKKHRHQQRSRAASYLEEDQDTTDFLNFSQPADHQHRQNSEPEDDDDFDEEDTNPSTDIPSKFLLYQQSVQSPKGDISYLQKFFLMYIGGRLPLHFQEDFCGTALLSTEWLRSDPRRTAVGVDLDVEALEWCLENNMNKVGSDIYSRISLFHGNVLQPLEAKLVKFDPQELISNIKLGEHGSDPGNNALESVYQVDSSAPAIDKYLKRYVSLPERGSDPGNNALESVYQVDSSAPAIDKYLKRYVSLPERDIVCAFNFSCCCLHKRADLILYFKHVLDTLSKKGGIFVMDLYGGTSSEGKLRLQRKFPNFTYVWEQDEFDIIGRKTRISLHFHLQKQKKKLRHAFSYSWRLWSLPEIKDCLEEAGFKSVHFWMREMPDSEGNKRTEGFGAGRDIKYEEVTSFEQVDSWSAYIVAVTK